MNRQLIALLFALLVGLTTQKSTHKFSTCFTNDPSNNNLIDSFDTVTRDSSNNGWKPSLDPNTIPSQRKGIIGYWPMETSSGGFTPDGSRQPLPAQIVGSATITANTGKFGGGLVLNNNGYLQFSGPLISSVAVASGFTYGIWAKTTSLTNAVLVSQQYTQPVLSMSGTEVRCTVHDSKNQLVSTAVRVSSAILNTWVYAACIYHPVNGLTTCANSNCSPSSNTTIDVLQGQNALTGIGSHPGGTVTTGFSGVLDELTVWNRPLTPTEVAALSSASSVNTPFYGVSFTSIPLDTSALGVSDSSIIDFWELQAAWNIVPIGSSTTDPSKGVLIELSTNQGTTWCAMTSNQLIDFNNSVCAMPAATVTFRATFLDNVVLTCLDLTITIQPDMTWNYFPLGINAMPYNYYAPTWVYTDAFKGAAPWSCNNLPCTSLQFDQDWYPLYVNGTQRPTTIFLSQSNFVNGTYTFMADGVGTIKPGFNCPGVTIRINGTVAQPVYCQTTSVGIQLNILDSSPSNPVRNIRVIMPGFDTTYQTQKFHPLYLERYNGSHTYRFMEWSSINGNNIAHWADRNLPSFAIQRAGKTTVLPLASFIDASTTGTSAFHGTQWLVKVTTVQPHNLVMGQQVTVYTNTPASVTVKLPGGTSTTRVLDVLSGLVDPIDNYSFYMDYSTSAFAAGTTLTSFTPSSSGDVTVTVNSGNNYDDAIEFCNTVNANCWINIPVVATDDFVTKYATLLRDNLKPNLKIYLEYSNEIWNNAFIQSTIVTKIGLANHLGALNDVRLRQTVYRTCQILAIFKQVFGDQAFNQRVVKLLGSQVSSYMVDKLLSFATNSTLNPQGFKFDGAAIAPYFGYSINTRTHNMFAMNITPTVDQALDMVRDAMWPEIFWNIRDCASVAAKYGAKLFGYEGGQGLVPEFGTYRFSQLPLYTAANRHPRMKAIYRQFYYQWMAAGADLMCHYSDYTTPSQYGFWGALEYQNQPTAEAYKYQAWLEAKLVSQGLMPNYPMYVDPPSTPTNVGSPSSPSQTSPQAIAPSSQSPSAQQTPSSPSQSTLSDATRSGAAVLVAAISLFSLLN